MINRWRCVQLCLLCCTTCLPFLDSLPGVSDYRKDIRILKLNPIPSTLNFSNILMHIGTAVCIGRRLAHWNYAPRATAHSLLLLEASFTQFPHPQKVVMTLLRFLTRHSKINHLMRLEDSRLGVVRGLGWRIGAWCHFYTWSEFGLPLQRRLPLFPSPSHHCGDETLP
jgi:hypothetical protein